MSSMFFRLNSKGTVQFIPQCRFCASEVSLYKNVQNCEDYLLLFRFTSAVTTAEQRADSRRPLKGDFSLMTDHQNLCLTASACYFLAQVSHSFKCKCAAEPFVVAAFTCSFKVSPGRRNRTAQIWLKMLARAGGVEVPILQDNSCQGRHSGTRCHKRGGESTEKDTPVFCLYKLLPQYFDGLQPTP
jgi:hypothetical protein